MNRIIKSILRRELKRGLRRVDNEDNVEYIDIFDSGIRLDIKKIKKEILLKLLKKMKRMR